MRHHWGLCHRCLLRCRRRRGFNRGRLHGGRSRRGYALGRRWCRLPWLRCLRDLLAAVVSCGMSLPAASEKEAPCGQDESKEQR